MKKIFLLTALTFLMCSGCGVVFGGKISTCQKQKPAPGEHTRQVRVAALVGDLCTGVLWLAVDFATGAIYKPCN